MLNIDDFISTKVNIIRNDHIHSARYIQKQVLQFIREFVEIRDFYNNRTELIQGLSKFSNAICKAKPLMGGIYTISHRIIEFIEEFPKRERNIQVVREEVLAEIDNLENYLISAEHDIPNLGTKLIINHNTIFTISYSSYVKDIFILARELKKRFTVHLVKSGPGNEGEKLAKEIAQAGIKVILFPDVDMVRAIQNSTFVLMGCDRIMQESFINKTGSHAACIIANDFDIPVYLASDTFKVLLKRDYLLRYDHENPREITDFEHEKLKIQNIYFEEVPLKYVSKVITEKGIFEKDEFAKRFLM
jgi:translation initiation factor 2B subunit (eIF-2B alpha/beta/delta family)